MASRRQMVPASPAQGALEAVPAPGTRGAAVAYLASRDVVPPRETESFGSLRRNLRFGLFAVLLVAGGGTAVGSQMIIAGAVTANGTVIVETSSKSIQHPTGGVVRALNVKEEQQVEAGDILLTLDDTVAKANLAVVANGYDDQLARLTRLLAERNGDAEVTFPADLVDRSKTDKALADTLAGEAKLFEARQTARQGQRSQLEQQIVQASQQIEGLTSQVAAKSQEIDLVGTELDAVKKLFDKKLVAINRMTELQRDATRLDGEKGALISNIAALRGRVAETQLKILQVDQDLRTEVGKDIADAQNSIRELAEKRVAAQDTLNRTVIASPQAGIVHELKVHTVGGVVSPAEVLMMIVPQNEQLIMEVKLQPSDIDHVFPTQKAVINFSAFDRTTTPQLEGEVKSVAPDLVQDQVTRTSYYTARIAVSKEEMARLKDLKLVPGMPIEAFLQTTDRTIISYLVKPLVDQMRRAFRET